ncbi:MAG TPA: hypothetical protein VFV38_14670 [Ktedonobacteraceae bacterium]|nr:hypothetical protein [Ktedonobacteraceae bacterium]
MIPILVNGGYALLQPFGLCFRQLPVPIPVLKKGQTTGEPEITTGDGNDADKIDSVWISDEDEEPDDLLNASLQEG